MKEENYAVSILQVAMKEGNTLGLLPVDRLRIIRSLMSLRFFPENSKEFEYEPAFGALEFKFEVSQHSVRVFLVKDEDLKALHILHVMSKKSDRLMKKTEIVVRTRLARLNLYKKLLSEMRAESKRKLYAIKGGSNE